MEVKTEFHREVQLINHTSSQIVYGIQILPTNDPYIETAEKAVAALAEVTPGAFLVDTLPIRWFHFAQMALGFNIFIWQ